MEFGLGFLWLDLSRKSEPLRSRLHERHEKLQMFSFHAHSLAQVDLTRIGRLDSFSFASGPP